MVVSFTGDAIEECSSPVFHCFVIGIMMNFDEEFTVLPANIFDSKVVNDERKLDGIDFLHP